MTGSGGFVGRALIAGLRARNYDVIALGRDVGSLEVGGDVEKRTFDPNATAANPSAFAGADAVVHLAGESVAGRWTSRKRRAIHDSRTYGTRLVIDSMRALSEKPAVLVGASATGYYGSRGDDPLDESSAPGSDFLAEVCVDWERETRAASEMGIRSVQIRTGIALGSGGALAQMERPFRLGLGGPIGSGKQFVPWIHLDDLVDLYIFAIERASLSGPINAVAPETITNARLAQTLADALHRPALVPVPSFALKALLGDFSQTLLNSQLVIPAAAQSAGFSWRYPTIESAMRAIYH
ncbi:MAG: TIGR01777 family oxidoreductase [Candidatus Eremiobacteraeota bacterium]|nr:TIGR01777 family oxidoreductase [Candidatus Eremiobacteraeota bacterium]